MFPITNNPVGIPIYYLPRGVYPFETMCCQTNDTTKPKQNLISNYLRAAPPFGERRLC